MASDLPAYFWLLYANEQHRIKVHGENELLGLARPAFSRLPFSGDQLAEQVRSVVDAARTATQGTKRVVRLADVKAICVSGTPEVQSQAVAASKAFGLDVFECGGLTQNYDALLQISDLRTEIGSWLFALIPRGGADDLYQGEAKSIPAGIKDLYKALKKGSSR